MDPESTGWENIIFRCAFMGMSFQEAKRRSAAIAEFSELGEYLNLPARTYSTGMFLRLAFAISTSVAPEILIMDEMISNFDVQYLEKAQRRLREVVDKANILALASHDMNVIQETCNKVVWLEHGSVEQFGPPEGVVQAYESFYRNVGLERTRADEVELPSDRIATSLMQNAKGRPAVQV
jgi:ABC-type polysaccharide/polyol phosphate transport system ATPase subunit